MVKAEDISYILANLQVCAGKIRDPYDAEVEGRNPSPCSGRYRKYRIDSLEHWIWRVAHNRYARYIAARNQSDTVLPGFAVDLADDLDIRPIL